jgi:DNA-binding response OmpR family regulator
MNGRILLVEDDDLIGTLIEVNLAGHAYEVTWARTGEDALARAAACAHDLVVLDHMLPGCSGLDVARDLRRRGIGTPILMLTVKSSTRDKVTALDAGVDDYLTKPFDVQELLARVRALIRRGQAGSELPAAARLSACGGELDLDSRRWRDRDGRKHDLTEKEAALLALLLKSASRTLTRADIIDEVWGMDAVPSERTVDNFILRLRRLIEVDPERPRHLLTVRGRGYRLEP